MNRFKGEAANLLYGSIRKLAGSDVIEQSGIERALGMPSKEGFGDYAFPCFALAKALGKSPNDVASGLSKIINDSLKGRHPIQAVKPAGGYLNFVANPVMLAGNVLSEILDGKSAYGSNGSGENKLVVVEYSSPNLGKPMHLGHIRSTIIGDSLVKILRFNGYRTFGINYFGDEGLHMGKVISAYEQWGDIDDLTANPDKEMFRLYVKFESELEKNPQLAAMAKAVIERLEKKDPHYVQISELMRNMGTESFDRIYRLLGVSFDETTGGGYFSERGKSIVHDGLSRGIIVKKSFKNKRGGLAPVEADEDASEAFGVELEKFDLPDKVLLRSDGTAIYSTQDLGAAASRFEQHGFHRMIYVVGNDQDLYFRQLFKALELLGYQWAGDCCHLSFGKITIEGQKMSSREGNVVFLEDVLNDAIRLAGERVRGRDFAASEKERISKAVGIGAVKYMVLSVDAGNNIDFSWKTALDLEANSAPYIQYTNARARRLIERGGEAGHYNPEEIMSTKEQRLTRHLSRFPDTVDRSGSALKPNLIASYLARLADVFNDFYQNVRVIGSNESNSRLALVKATQATMSTGLGLLGIEAPEKM